MRRLIVSLSAVALMFGSFAAPDASAQQSVSFYLGGFTPRALDARPDEDVLVANGAFLATDNRLSGIDIGKFNNVTVGGEWLFAMTRNVEGGLGVGFYQRAVHGVYGFGAPEWDRHRADAEAPGCPVQRDGAPPSIRQRSTGSTVHRRGSRRVQLAL